MSRKHSPLLSAAISTVTVAAIVALGYPNTSQAFEVDPALVDAVTQVLPKNMPKKSPVNASESASKQPHPKPGLATYEMKNPSIRFDYDPNVFVIESFEATAKTSLSDSDALLTESLYLWTKKDYLAIAKAGGELSDFPHRIKISVYENPEGLPLQDWIVTQRDLPAQAKVENVQKSDKAFAGQEAWTYDYTSLVRYENVAFKDAKGRVIVASFGLPSNGSTAPKADDSVDLEAIADYLVAAVMMNNSIELTAS